MALEPVAGFAGSRSLTGVQTDFLALGPIPSDRILEQVDLVVSASGDAAPQVCTVGVAVVGGPVETALAFAAGTQLVQASDATASGIPLLEFTFGASGVANCTLYPGVPVPGGAVWVLFRLDNVSAAARMAFVASLRLLRPVRADRRQDDRS